MLSSPVAISNKIPPTSISNESRSSSCAGERAGGQANSFGATDHSLASTTGVMMNPSPTCTPSVRRNSHDGLVGQSNSGKCSHPTLPGIACPNRGLYATQSSSPVTITNGSVTSKIEPKTEVSHGPRSGLRNADSLARPGGRCRSSARQKPAGNPYSAPVAAADAPGASPSAAVWSRAAPVGCG